MKKSITLHLLFFELQEAIVSLSHPAYQKLQDKLRRVDIYGPPHFIHRTIVLTTRQALELQFALAEHTDRLLRSAHTTTELEFVDPSRPSNRSGRRDEYRRALAAVAIQSNLSRMLDS